MEKQLGRSQSLYVVQAAVEYLVALSASGTFLAKLTASLGMSDSLTGVLTSLMTMGCLFQLLSVFVKVRRVKLFVILTSMATQLLFVFMYFIPLVPLGPQVKTAALILTVFSAHLVLNMAGPRKTNWLMGLVDDHKRGTFSATKEMLSLFLGILFSYAMGAAFDHLEADGRLQSAFVLMAMVITMLMLIHALILSCVIPPKDSPQPQTLRQTFSSLAGSRNLYRIMGAYVFYNILTHMAAPFYATYQLHELGFSLKLVSLLTMVGSVVRMAVSKFWGRHSDRYSFSVTLEKCFGFLGASYVCAAFATPRNGAVMFALYYAFHGIAMGGASSAISNLVFDYIPHEERVSALAVCPAVGGSVGFATTLVFGAVLSCIQQSGAGLFGMPLYAQQILSFATVPLMLLGMWYLRTQITRKIKRCQN